MFESMTAGQMLLSAAILLIAFFVRGIVGFGSGLIGIPLLALFLPVTMVVPVVALLDYAASMAHSGRHRSHVNWRVVWPFIPFMLLGVGLALYLFSTLDAVLLRKLLGGFILLYAVYMLSGFNPHDRSSAWWAVPTGTMGGLVSTLFGTGGPMTVIYLHLRGLEKQAFRASIAVMFLMDGTSRILGYVVTGFMPLQALYLALCALPLVAVAMYAGGHIHTTIKQQTFNQLIGWLLIASG
ncbi:MAG: sulfite exporter TauE/SafE family protein, partial [Gammaproteobacteria bacterium]|nr:sulfite exporter TauE/SafE family protein [Gammaproteobacteria bacterium]